MNSKEHAVRVEPHILDHISHLDYDTNECSVNEGSCPQIDTTIDNKTKVSNQGNSCEGITHDNGQGETYETKGVDRMNSSSNNSIVEGGNQNNATACSIDNDLNNGDLEGRLLFDINHNCDFEGDDLFNFVKNGWKKYMYRFQNMEKSE